jgi:hypothetical protein
MGAGECAGVSYACATVAVLFQGAKAMRKSSAIFVSAIALGLAMFVPLKASAQGVSIYIDPGYPGYGGGYPAYHPPYPSYGYAYPSYGYA